MNNKAEHTAGVPALQYSINTGLLFEFAFFSSGYLVPGKNDNHIHLNSRAVHNSIHCKSFIGYWVSFSFVCFYELFGLSRLRGPSDP